MLVQKTKKSYQFEKDGEKTVGYTVKVAPSEKLTADALVQRVAEKTHADPAMIEYAIGSLVRTMVDYISLGHAVQMGSFGTFRPSVNTKMSAQLADVSQSNVRRVKLIFTPGKAFRKMLSEMEMEFSTDDSDTLLGETTDEDGGDGTGEGGDGGGSDTGGGTGGGSGTGGGGHDAD